MKTLLIKLVVLWLTGPAIIAVALFSGADLFDGLFGEYSNTPLQSFALRSGLLLTTLGWLAAAVLSLVTLFRGWHRHNRFVLLLLVLIHVPLLMLVVSEIV